MAALQVSPCTMDVASNSRIMRWMTILSGVAEQSLGKERESYRVVTEDTLPTSYRALLCRLSKHSSLGQGHYVHHLPVTPFHVQGGRGGFIHSHASVSTKQHHVGSETRAPRGTTPRATLHRIRYVATSQSNTIKEDPSHLTLWWSQVDLGAEHHGELFVVGEMACPSSVPGEQRESHGVTDGWTGRLTRAINTAQPGSLLGSTSWIFNECGTS